MATLTEFTNFLATDASAPRWRWNREIDDLPKSKIELRMDADQGEELCGGCDRFIPEEVTVAVTLYSDTGEELGSIEDAEDFINRWMNR